MLITTFLAFVAFYAPQPLLPFLAADLNGTPERAATLMTVCFAALAIAPLIYGLVLQRVSTRQVLVLATLLLGLLHLAFAMGQSIEVLVGVRAAQALLFPAIFTAAVTYCSRAGEADATASRVATYVATTILGGFGGRLIGGFASDLFGWRLTFIGIGIALLLTGIGLYVIVRDHALSTHHSKLRDALAILKSRTFAAGYSVIFLVFFAFVSVFNALPFRIVDVQPNAAPSTVSLVYIGYIIGVVIALNITWITRHSGGVPRANAIAVMSFLLGLILSGSTHLGTLIAAGFLMCIGLFTVHASLSGYLNALQPEASSLINGLYIAIYYTAGALGSVLPLILYQRFGWTSLLILVSAALILTFIPLHLLSRYNRSTSAR